MDGGEVERYVREGRIAEVAAYCETDVGQHLSRMARHELFRGRLSRAEFEASEDNLLGFLQERVGAKPHLSHLTGACLRASSENVAPEVALPFRQEAECSPEGPCL